MDMDLGTGSKFEAVQKLVGVWPLLGEVERISLLAAVRCLSCQNYAGCETAQSNPADRLLAGVPAR
jgi:hypothetical protein